MPLKITAQRFYRGESIWSVQSGLLAICETPPAGPPQAAQPTGHVFETLARLPIELADALPVLRESRVLADKAAWMRHAHPAAYWAVAVAEVMARDFCWQPAIGQVESVKKDKLRLFVPASDEAVAVPALGFALFLLEMAWRMDGRAPASWAKEVAQGYQNARLAMRRGGLNQSTLAIARCAFGRGIPVNRLQVPGQLTQLGQGVHAKRIAETATSLTSMLAVSVSKDKLSTALFFARAGLPTAGTQAAATRPEAQEIAQRLGFPLVVKPRSAGKGKGVAVDIRTEKHFHEALDVAARFQQGVIVERFVQGDDHRLLVVGGRLVAAAKRTAAHVIGDGVSTVAQLIAKENLDPQRGMPFERLKEKIGLGAEALRHLDLAGLSAQSIPEPGQHVRLSGAANISQGGSAVDVTDQVHPDNRAMAERAARIAGLDICGIDFLTPDISRSWRELTCAILEINATPGLRPHLVANRQRDVVGPIVDYLFAQGSDGRVPTVGITGSLGKTTTARMVAAIVAGSGRRVGLSTTQGAWIGSDCVRVGDVAGGGMALELLKDPTVEAGVFELSRGGLLKRGMALDSVDVGVVLQVADNHVGIDGLRNRTDIARVKAIVAHRARRWVVLNADDPLCLSMRPASGGPAVCLVSAQPDGVVIQDHLAAGGTCVTLHGRGTTGFLRLQRGVEVIGQVDLAAVPATLGGSFMPAIWNAMSATAAAHCLGIDMPTICQALARFVSSFEANPGRMNQIRGLPFDVILTIADGPVAYGALAQFARDQYGEQPKTLIFQAAGDRPDAFILDSARAVAGAFDRYVCCDMEEDLRGRPSGEVAALLALGLKQASVPESAIEVHPSSTDALHRALQSAADGSLVVVSDYAAHKVMTSIRAIWPGAH